jgi:hypothetical protein
MNDWPDRYIHTNRDSAANIDPTKLKRAAFIGAASGYFLANFSSRDMPAADRAVAAGRLMRSIISMERQSPAGPGEEYERAVRASLQSFGTEFPAAAAARTTAAAAKHGDVTRYRRRDEPRGPLMVFGYDYFAEHARTARISNPKLLDYRGAWGAGEEYAYEALNFADGRHTAPQIAEELSAEYGPVTVDLVREYLEALKQIGVVE